MSMWRVGAAFAASFVAWHCAVAGPVNRVQVKIVTGAQDLVAGSVVELRIYEVGKAVRHVALAHGESWPHDSTRLIPVSLTETMDPRTITRIGLYYRAPNALAAPWEVVAAEVEIPTAGATVEPLLGATLSGTLTGQGELGSEERDAASMTCVSDADCDDHRRCNGRERCAPHSPGADARGCVKGAPLVCPVNQVCTEDRGCRGLDAPKPAPMPAPTPPPVH